MAHWGDWMVPEISLHASLELEHSKRAVRAHCANEPDKVADLCCSLLEQNAMLHGITRKAAKRISELELQELLSDEQPQPMSGPNKPLPWLLRLMLRLHGFRLDPEDVAATPLSGAAP